MLRAQANIWFGARGRIYSSTETAKVDAKILAQLLGLVILWQFFNTSIPQYLNTSIPQYHNTSIPQYLNASILNFFNTSILQYFNSQYFNTSILQFAILQYFNSQYFNTSILQFAILQYLNVLILQYFNSSILQCLYTKYFNISWPFLLIAARVVRSARAGARHQELGGDRDQARFTSGLRRRHQRLQSTWSKSKRIRWVHNLLQLSLSLWFGKAMAAMTVYLFLMV